MIYESDIDTSDVLDDEEYDVFPCPFCCELECPSDCITYDGNGRGWIYDYPREDMYDDC